MAARRLVSPLIAITVGVVSGVYVFKPLLESYAESTQGSFKPEDDHHTAAVPPLPMTNLVPGEVPPAFVEMPKVRSSRSAATSYADHLVDIPVDPGLDALPRHHLPGNSPPSSDDGQADADGDYVPGPNDHLAQQVYAEAQPQGQEEVTASYYAPDGFRFCSGCRSNKKVDDFNDGRKMCYRHKKPKGSDAPAPEVVTVEDLRVQLKAKSAEDGVAKFDASIDLSTLPGQEDVEFELSNVIVGAALVNPQSKPLDSAAENMRQARVRVKPLVNLILEATGYSFVYKDCREGRKQKYSYSLRYLCAQRADQDGTKRRSAAAAATPAPEPRAPTPPPPPPSMLEPLDHADTDGQIRAAILAMVQANTAGNVDDAYAIPVGPEIPEAGPSGMSESGMGGSQSGMDVDGSVGDGDEEKGGKGRRGKGWRKGLGKTQDPNKKPPVKRVQKEGGKPRAPQKKMDRYECKGCLVVNLFAGTDNAHFTITHLLQHPEYVDIVGNRVRGPRFVPPPIPLSTTLEDPVGTIEIGEETDPPLERLERTFHAMLDLLKVLKTKKHGGEDEVVRALYAKSEEVRRYRVSVSEAIARNAKGKDRLKEKLESSRKRKHSHDDDARRENPLLGPRAHEEDVLAGGMSQQQVDEVLALTALTTSGAGQEEMVVQFLQRTAEQEAADGERAVEEAVAKTVAQTWMGQLDPALGGGL